MIFSTKDPRESGVGSHHTAAEGSRSRGHSTSTPAIPRRAFSRVPVFQTESPSRPRSFLAPWPLAPRPLFLARALAREALPPTMALAARDTSTLSSVGTHGEDGERWAADEQVRQQRLVIVVWEGLA